MQASPLQIAAATQRMSVALMKFLSGVAKRLGVGEHVYVVGGAVRNWVIGEPIKDIDVVIDPVALRRPDASAWFAKEVQKAIPVHTNLTTNNYGVAILTIKGDWELDGENLNGEVIEIANARKESYGGEEGKGYKPHMVEPATIEEDTVRREFTFNTLMWRLYDLANGPDKAEILDLTGCGLRDLQERTMRCPSDPDKTFTDDPSRMIRAIKFLIKYGFKIAPDVEASIRRNAQKLKNIPAGHLSNMIIGVFYEGGIGKRALLEMEKLGLLEVVKEIAQTDRGFREALGNWAEKKADLATLFDLMDMGMPTGKKIQFLTAPQRARVREITVQMGADAAGHLVDALEQPGKVLDTPTLIQEFGLKGAEIRQLTQAAQEALLDDPILVTSPTRLTERVRQRIRQIKTATVVAPTAEEIEAGELEASYFNLGDTILYGKYKNHRGIIKEFKQDERGIPTAVIQPDPQGRKKDKEIGVFKFWHADPLKREAALVLRVAAKWQEQIPGGLAKGKKPEDFNQAALAKGQKVEMEHTGDPDLAQEITMDHLTEDPDYYDKLEVMERQAGTNQEVIEAPHNFHPVEVQPPKAKRKKFPFQGYIDFQGLEIDVENEKGSTREGESSDGTKWSTKMFYHYGEIRGTEGVDGDKLDCYVGDNHDSSVVVVIHHHNPETGGFDEDKVMLGFDSIEEAIGAYKKQYDKPGFYVEDDHLAMPIGQFWRWVHGEKNRGKKVKEAEARLASAQTPRRKLANPALLHEYPARLKEFREAVQHSKSLNLGNTTTLWVAWHMFYKVGQEWAAYVIDHLAFPPRVAKAVEMAARLFSRPYGFGKGPSDIIKWFESNEARLVLLDQARAWPERSEESGIFKQGPFIVHNTVQAVGPDLDNAVAIIDRATRAVSGSGVPGFAQMAYGTLFLVGQIKRKNWAAWYVPSRDVIYLRPRISGISMEESVRHLVHELGHRFWTKKLDKDSRVKWLTHHTDLVYGHVDTKLPEVGDVLPLQVNKKTVRVEQYEQPSGKATLVDVATNQPVGSVGLAQLMGWVREVAKRGKFPTPYSATTPEEHFCEALSLYALNKLTGSNLEAFNEIMLGVNAATVARVAARYQKKKEVPKAEGKGTTTVYEYSDRQVALRNHDKAERVEKLRGKIGDLREKYRKDLTAEDEQTRNTALAVALIDETFERVGNEDSASEGHFGVTGWKVKHVTFGDGKATISYVGKSGVKQEKVVESKPILKALKAAVKGKGDEDLVCEGEDCEVTSAEVNAYLEPFDVTAKDLRGFHANSEMQKRLKAIRAEGGALPKNPKEKKDKLTDEFQEALEATAEAVGHEASTLKSQYLVPGLEDEFLKDGEVSEKLDKRGSIYARVASRWVAAMAVKPNKLIKTAALNPNQGQWNNRWDLVQSETQADLPLGSQLCADTANEALAAQYMPNLRLAARTAYRWATKSDAEKEDAEAERLVRPSPKKKPPREDLRREHMEEPDEDTQGAGAENDEDLSLNYKRVAARWIMRLAKKAPLTKAPVAKKRKPGDVWKSEKGEGWVAKNKDDVVHAFPEKEQAEAYAKGEESEEKPAQEKPFTGTSVEEFQAFLKKNRDPAKVTDFLDSLQDTLKREDVQDKKDTDPLPKDSPFLTEHDLPAGFKTYGDVRQFVGPEAPVEKAPKEEKKPAAPQVKSIEEFVGGLDKPGFKTMTKEVKDLFGPGGSFGKNKDEQSLQGEGEGRDFNPILESLGLPPHLFKTFGDVREFIKQAPELAKTVGKPPKKETPPAAPTAPAPAAPTPTAPATPPVAPATPAPAPTAPAAAPPVAPPEPEAVPEPEPAKDTEARVPPEVAKMLEDVPAKDLPKDQAGMDRLVSTYEAEKTSLKERAKKGYKSLMKDAEKALKSPGKGTTPEDQGRSLALAQFARETLANPSKIGGKAVSDEEKTPQQLQERSQEAFEQFSSAGENILEEAAKQMADQLAATPEDSPKRQELDSILEGLALAASMAEKPVPESLHAPHSDAQVALAKALKAKGKVNMMLEPVERAYSPQGRKVIQEALEEIGDDEFHKVMGGKDGVWDPVFEVMQGSGLDPDVRKVLREFLQTMAVDSMTTIHSMAVSAYEGKKSAIDAAADRVGKDKRVQDALTKFTDACLSGTKCDPTLDDEVRKTWMEVWMEQLRADGIEPDKADPVQRQVLDYIKSGDPMVWGREYVRAGELETVPSKTARTVAWRHMTRRFLR